jgi:hypothetical protein
VLGIEFTGSGIPGLFGDQNWAMSFQYAYFAASEVVGILGTILLVATFAVVPRTVRAGPPATSDRYEPYS